MPLTGVLYGARFDRTNMSEVRRHVRRYAAAVGLNAVRLDDFIIAVSEILANAVLHGGGDGRISLRRDGASVRCVVTDHGKGLPDGYDIARPADPATQGGGRGLWLARTLCDRVTLLSSPGGTLVELTLSLP